MQSIPCFLCGRGLEKRVSKKQKPYFICYSCGIQLFVRGKQGIEQLEQFFNNAEKAELPYRQRAQNFHEMQAILKEIADVKSEIENLGLCFFDEDKLRTRKALETRVETLFRALEKFAKNKNANANSDSQEVKISAKCKHKQMN
jgi:hypothetical protein